MSEHHTLCRVPHIVDSHTCSWHNQIHFLSRQDATLQETGPQVSLPTRVKPVSKKVLWTEEDKENISPSHYDKEKSHQDDVKKEA